MLTTPIRRTAMAVAALGALGLGGSAIAGTELEVHVGTDFAVVNAQQRPAHP